MDFNSVSVHIQTTGLNSVSVYVLTIIASLSIRWMIWKNRLLKKHLISHFLDELSLDTKIRCTKCHFIYTVWSPLQYVRGTHVLRTKRLISHVFLWKRVRQNVSPCHSKCGTDKTFNSNGVFSVWIECFIWNVKQWINESINQSSIIIFIHF